MQPSEFDPLLYLRLADDLVTEAADEAILRTAIGRAYYAVFLSARAKVGVRGRHQAHERVRQAISPMNARAASLLGGMSYYRLVADYELTPENPQFQGWSVTWRRVRRDAAEVLAALNNLPEFISDQADE